MGDILGQLVDIVTRYSGMTDETEKECVKLVLLNLAHEMQPFEDIHLVYGFPDIPPGVEHGPTLLAGFTDLEDAQSYMREMIHLRAYNEVYSCTIPMIYNLEAFKERPFEAEVRGL